GQFVLNPGDADAAPGEGEGEPENVGVWYMTDLPVGATATLTITVQVEDDAVGQTLVNAAWVEKLRELDKDLNNNSGTATFTVPAGTDLAVSKTVDDATPAQGETIHYTVTVENVGSTDATGVHVADPLPAGLSFVSASGAYDSGTGDWDVGGLAPG